MKFMIVMSGDESFMEQATPEQMQEVVAQMDAYNKELEEAGVMVGGEGLAPSSETKTLRYGQDGGVVVTDGPFTESKEQFAGYWIFETDSIDEAVEWAKKAPLGGAVVEVRQIAETAEENFDKFQEQAKK